MTQSVTLSWPMVGQPLSENKARGAHWAVVRHRLAGFGDGAWVSARNALVTGQVPWLAHPGATTHLPVTVQVAIPFPTRRRRDPHNYVGTVVKAIVDGLVRAGLVPDDTPDWVTVIEPTLVVDTSQRPHVHVTITERSPTHA